MAKGIKELNDIGLEDDVENSVLECRSLLMAVEVLFDEEDVHIAFAGDSGQRRMRLPSLVSSSRSGGEGEDGLGDKLSWGEEEDIVEAERSSGRSACSTRRKWISYG